MRRIFFVIPLLALFGAGCQALPFQSTERTTCSYETATYQNGETFPASDGCNTCSCGDDGLISCTKMACQTALPIMNCQTDGDCVGQNIDNSLCAEATYACVNNVCELSCKL